MSKELTEQWRNGNRFGKLTVLGFHHKDKHYHRYSRYYKNKDVNYVFKGFFND